MRRWRRRNFWRLWVASLAVISFISRFPFPIFSLLLALSADLLVGLEFLALLRGELDAGVVRHQLAEAFSACCRVGLLA